jgi:hypothetical protein
MTNWEPHRRVFDERLSRDPVGWIGTQLADLETLLANAGVELDDELAADAEQLRGSAAEIQRAVSSMLDKVKSGELAGAPTDDGRASVRVSWL